ATECCRLSSFAKARRGSFVRAISSARMCAQKQRLGACAVRHLEIHVKKAWIFKEIASWPEKSAFPKWQEGRHPHCHFRGLRSLSSRYGPPHRSAAQGDLCHEASAQTPHSRAARQLPDLSTIIRVDPSSTGDSRRQGALPAPDPCSAVNSVATLQ